MASPKREPVSSPFFHWIALAVFLLITVGSPAVRAQSASSEARAQKSGAPSKKTSKPTGAKTKLRARATAKAAKPAAESAAQPPPEAEEKAGTTPPVRTSETVDFDTDADDVQKLEPGLDLIQAAPRPARHRSLVPASPSPEDSVVNRQ